MAWQSPSAMNSGGAAGGGDNNGPAGTEYTLQGVMRFLQLEWHNHERARNAWDIERAEMKAKIAKQEGEVRSAKKLNDALNRQIRMLEQALRNERAKKAAAAGENANAAEEKKDPKAKAGVRLDFKSSMNAERPFSKHLNSFLDIEPEDQDKSEADKDSQREKSKLYLTKCVEEITYLLTPPAHPPPPQGGFQGLANTSQFLNQGDAPIEEMYLQHRQKPQPHMASPGPNSSIPNHQPPPVPSVSDIPNLTHSSHPPQQATFMSREPYNQQPLSKQAGMPSTDASAAQFQQQATQGFSSVPEEQVEKVTHNYDSHGRPIPNRDEEATNQRHVVSDDPDGWNFEEPTSLNEPPPDIPPPRRPDTDAFPSANSIPAKSPPRGGPHSHRRKSSGSTSMSRRRSEGHETREGAAGQSIRSDPQSFKVRFALRGHLDVVRSVIFTGGGSPSEPEICTAGDDGMIKRWIIPASYMGQHGMNNDLDIQSYFSHRGHEGVVTSLAACPASATFSTGGRVSGDGWIFSGGQDATVRVWERGRVDPKATLDGHTDAVWTVCVLPATCASVFGQDCNNYGGPDRILLASGSADGTVKIWAVSAPPQLVSPQTGSRRGIGGSRRHSVTSGSNFPSSPQPSVATSTPFHHMLIHTIDRPTHASPTCISPLSMTGEAFIVSYTDAAILIFDTRTGEEIIGMASGETYKGTPATGVNSVVVTSVGLEGTMSVDSGRGVSEDESIVHGATGSSSGGGVEGVVISGHEDRFIRLFDANSGQCTYSMLAHPSSISSLSLSKDGREAVSAGHDASIRFWSLEKRICTQEIASHRIMRGEGVCSVVWSQDGRLVVSAGGDGVVKVFAR
ncbi:WD40 repeat-like protein [Lepidopterella palustris CBS 459.81]|uniref:WD40 repeat-like protein n=1 Tax=Lepidopterella palustris CBS 459.81 TaxID=1314670 RepID=A0A8E2EFG3_9PEZI|nr:WD40 repeat-like protein [Lepidopterella palustris CBS 459.81]